MSAPPVPVRDNYVGLSEALRQALQLYQQGKLDQAELGFRTILTAHPNQFEAKHMLGVLRCQQGRNTEAVELIGASPEINPDSATAWSNLATALAKLRRLDDALTSYDRALAIKPDYAEAWNNRGNALVELKRFEEALRSYDQALASRPDFVEAHNNRGVALINLRRPEEALASYEKALAIKPDYADALNNRGKALKDLSRAEEAVASYDQALASRPNFVEAHNNRGIALINLRRPGEALASYDRALAIKSDYPEAWNNRGNALVELERFGDALQSYDQALARRPDFAEALNNRGIALMGLRRPEEALASYEKALAIKPDYADALNNRGNALRDLSRAEEAVASYDRALASRPDFVEAHNNRGIALINLRRPEEALASYEKALAIRPDYADAHNNRGNALMDLSRAEEAVASYDRALAIKPDYADALNNRGVALRDLKRPGEAMASCEKALAIEPDYADAYFNHGLSALLLGNFWSGWKGYERRYDARGVAPRKLTAPFPIWKGEDIEAKRIIVYEEQGLGDIIQFSRYLGVLTSQGAAVTFLVRASLRRLLQPGNPAVRLVDEMTTDEVFDFQSALLSLPGVLRTTPETVPATVPYLFPEAPVVDHWRGRIGEQGLKVGIAWQGNTYATAGLGRSIPLRCFRPIAALPGVRLISLQKNDGVDQLSQLNSAFAVETFGAELDNGADAFIDTAAIMACLDLIVTSDTSIAHLAGALGRPVWLALKHVPEWRWMLDRSDSPWYPTMTLYRQTARDDWDGVFERMAADMAKLGSGAGMSSATVPRLPSSIGELFDKIAILEIKSARIDDPAKLGNVEHELRLLREIEARFRPFSAELTRLVAGLKRVNEGLWDIEDAIRDCERRQEFGADFVSLARSIYKINDRRAALKRQLNTRLGSEIVEEKSYTSIC